MNHIKIWSLQFNVKFNTQIKHRKAESAAPNLWLSDSSCWVRTYTRTIQLLPYLQGLDTAGSSASFDLADFYTRRPSCNPQRICVNFQPGINPGICHFSCKCANLYWWFVFDSWNITFDFNKYLQIMQTIKNPRAIDASDSVTVSSLAHVHL